MLALVPGLALAQWGDAYSAEEPLAQPQEQVADGQTAPPGQWVYTQQYGWVWMPYGDAYSYVPPDGEGEPYEYVYYPSYGWNWVVAPWIWGYGAWPHFGVYGPGRFGWYGHGWWRTPGRWNFRPSVGRAAFGGHGFVGQGRFAGSPRFAAGSRHFAGGARFGGGGHFGGGGRGGGGHSGGGGRGGGGHR